MPGVRGVRLCYGARQNWNEEANLRVLRGKRRKGASDSAGECKVPRLRGVWQNTGPGHGVGYLSEVRRARLHEGAIPAVVVTSRRIARRAGTAVSASQCTDESPAREARLKPADKETVSRKRHHGPNPVSEEAPAEGRQEKSGGVWERCLWAGGCRAAGTIGQSRMATPGAFRPVTPEASLLLELPCFSVPGETGQGDMLLRASLPFFFRHGGRG